ncbi:SMP-30/gluconolactonase/LRE family protein [Altererythrobacter sp. HHU K3-1]|uniref:SMP-30/gluconolactonase/LRE family protein n=1 Tax=Qipengyuania atrilutea TaxID=2744473 RepID=A0A850H444_9SPHN|nr:SMP-30/gluconolactonase/LRE family protein [Actirhodobacter atriluteus]
MRVLAISSALLVASCAQTGAADLRGGQGAVTPSGQNSSRLAALIPSGSELETLGSGLQWAEGPVWIDDDRGGYLLLTDVPGNAIHKWSEGSGFELWMKPSGFTGAPVEGMGSPGANGLLAGLRSGTILLADHGNRAVYELDLATKAKRNLADRFGGKPFNSPNDLVTDRAGNLYFTDPPYGLAAEDASPLKKQAFNGVYRLDKSGTVTLIDDSLTRPNGIALSPDEQTLYVANSNSERAIWMRYVRQPDGSFGNGSVFYDATALIGSENPGLPDGMVVDKEGFIYATGPGGVLVFSPSAELLGTVRTGGPVANVTIGGPKRDWLYLAANDKLMRIRLAGPRL